MEQIQKKTYETPELTVVKFHAECGYSLSSGTEFTQMFLWDNSESTDQMEDYSTANDWRSGTNNFWN